MDFDARSQRGNRMSQNVSAAKRILKVDREYVMCARVDSVEQAQNYNDHIITSLLLDELMLMDAGLHKS